MSRYTCSQAKIIADNGNIMQADIMETGELYTNQLFEIRTNLRKDYWALHGQIASLGFDHMSDQTDAIATLGELALALKAVENAYSALNTVRCFT